MANFHVTGDKGKAPLVADVEERNTSRSASPTHMELKREVELKRFQPNNFGYKAKAVQIRRIRKGSKRAIAEVKEAGVEADVKDTITDEIRAHLAALNQSLSSIPRTEKVFVFLELPQPEAPIPQLSTESAGTTSVSCAAVINGSDGNEQAVDSDRSEDVVDSNRVSRQIRRRVGEPDIVSSAMTRARCTAVEASGGLGASPQETEAPPMKARKNKTPKKKQLIDTSDSVVRKTAVGDGETRRRVPRARPTPKTIRGGVDDPSTPPPMAINVHPIPNTDLGSVDGAPTPRSSPASVSNARPIRECRVKK